MSSSKHCPQGSDISNLIHLIYKLKMFCARRCYVQSTFFLRDDVYSLIVYWYINNIVRTETIWVDAFFKNTEEPLAMMWVFYNGLLVISSIRHEHCSEICISLCPTMTWCQSINISRNLREQLTLGERLASCVLALLRELDGLFASCSEGQIFPLQLSASVGVLPGEGLLSFSGQKEVIPFIGSEKHAVLCAAIKYASHCARDKPSL